MHGNTTAAPSEQKRSFTSHEDRFLSDREDVPLREDMSEEEILLAMAMVRCCPQNDQAQDIHASCCQDQKTGI